MREGGRVKERYPSIPYLPGSRASFSSVSIDRAEQNVSQRQGKEGKEGKEGGREGGR